MSDLGMMEKLKSPGNEAFRIRATKRSFKSESHSFVGQLTFNTTCLAIKKLYIQVQTMKSMHGPIVSQFVKKIKLLICCKGVSTIYWNISEEDAGKRLLL